MMRVIRTEMYFDDVSGASRRRRYWAPRDIEEKNHGLAFAWFRSHEVGPFDIKNEKAFGRVREIEIGQVPFVLDTLLRDVDGEELEFGGRLFEGNVQNPNVIDSIFEQMVILEQSPPEGVRFKDLLKRTNAPIYVGTFMGAGLAMEHPALMFITIPLGIVVVGSSIGVSEAMASALNKRIQRMFDRRRR